MAAHVIRQFSGAAVTPLAILLQGLERDPVEVAAQMPGETARILMGPDAINGEAAQKYKITYIQQGRQESVYEWLGSSEVPLKIQAMDGSWSVEYRNIHEGPQDDSLFEIPAGYQKFAMPSLPSNMQEMMAGGQTEGYQQ